MTRETVRALLRYPDYFDPFGMVIVCSIGVAIADNFFPEIEKLSYDGYASVGLGVMMILSSLFCRYGAEVCDGKASLENIEHAES